ncbi:MAG: translation initiation factor IF-2 [Patescibacteria group bacterium]|nr:translation initiation factor IF-2 [Patescibacteria group bacterium]
MKKKSTQSNIVPRPPVVVVMGHVDHGKSTLLDYIRKTNVVEDEVGGITQQISAYEVNHNNKMITFLDTPGHESFSKMRSRGAQAADIAVLVVSAEDSVKTQTLEAWKTITEREIPYIVAINKIDKSNTNVEKTKNDLVSEGIYLEGMGGEIPFVLISSKTGEGISELLDMITLVSDLNEFTGNKNTLASGIIIESNCNPKRGNTATCLILNGTLTSDMFVVTGKSMVKARIMENFLGKPIKKASFSSPVLLVGFDKIPEVGMSFSSYDNKKEAEKNKIVKKVDNDKSLNEFKGKIIPLTIKTGVMGTIEAIEKEIDKLNNDEIVFKIVNKGVGSINESDLKMSSINKDSVIIGFNVKIDNEVRDLNESLKVKIEIFNIIYKLTDWLKEIMEEKRPRKEVTEVIGSVKILKTFNTTKGKQLIGGKVTTGYITNNSNIRILRRDTEIGQGKIIQLQEGKIKTKEIREENECGILVESKVEIASGDVLESLVKKIK